MLPKRDKDDMPLCGYKGCGNLAKYNLQNWWHLYEVTDGTYNEIQDWEGDDNSYYCKEHAETEGFI